MAREVEQPNDKCNSALRSLYALWFERIQRVRYENRDPTLKKLSHPLLLRIPASYWSQPRRLMIVGQQTYGWDDKAAHGIDDLLALYERFQFGKHYRKTPFWNVTTKAAARHGVDRLSLAWTNLFRCDEGGGRPRGEVAKQLLCMCSIVRSEVHILKPNIVLFFTGPNYDRVLDYAFPDRELEVVPEFSVRQLARVVHPELPSMAYRTYHPQYLRRSRLEQRFLDFLGASAMRGT